ncbi:unnamed protein product, partial [Staurois parvus]
MPFWRFFHLSLASLCTLIQIFSWGAQTFDPRCVYTMLNINEYT